MLTQQRLINDNLTLPHKKEFELTGCVTLKTNKSL